MSNQSSRRMNWHTHWQSIFGAVLITTGVLPVIFPTTYFRWSPLARPAAEYQNRLVYAKSCEVCGRAAEKEVVLPGTEIRYTRLGARIGPDPREWPGNAHILLCHDHVDGYTARAKPQRLARLALIHLTRHGANPWLGPLAVCHVVLACFGALLLARREYARPISGDE